MSDNQIRMAENKYPNFNSSKAESEAIFACVDRLEPMVRTAIDRTTLIMDLTACTTAGALDPARLLAARDCDFIHDITGIQRYIDRRTGELTHCFWPRCAPT